MENLIQVSTFLIIIEMSIKENRLFYAPHEIILSVIKQENDYDLCNLS